VGAVTVVLAAALSYPNWHVRPLSMMSALIGVAIMGMITSFGVRLFIRQKNVLDDVKETSQAVRRMLHRMVQRPVPERLRSLRAEVRYLNPPDARMAADMCSVEDTPFGVRMLVGDVAGRGSTSMGIAMEISCAFRDLAWTEERLPLLATHLHSALARCSGGSEAGEFVTVLLGQATGGTIRLLSCGHPPPMLLRGSQVVEVDVRPSPPLGLLHLGDGRLEQSVVKLDGDDRLLLYTNGVTHARDDNGRPFPLAEQIMALAGEDSVVLLDALQRALLDHACEPLDDDVVLLLIQPDRRPLRAMPSKQSMTDQMTAETIRLAAKPRLARPHGSHRGTRLHGLDP
jgi:hypothetical protein